MILSARVYCGGFYNRCDKIWGLLTAGKGYIPALDGLRTVAVVAVVLYHMNASLLPGGLMGVTIFFVLSGYLITGILIKEWNKTGSINLPHFWMNRVRRLVPAILFMVLGTTVLTALFAPDMLTRLRDDIVSALFFFSNWWFIFQDLSYFDAMGAPSPVNHFWSLAIEEQFYLVLPPVLLLLFRKRIKRRNIQIGLVVAIAVSALLMAVLYDPSGDPSRVYYGTDTRIFSLLIGSLFAFLFPPARILGHGPRGFTVRQRKLLGWCGLASFAGIVVFMMLVNGFSPFLYRGGILLVSLLTAVLIVSLVFPPTPLARLLSLGPLVWLGKISYSIYLWHYPLLVLMNPRNFTGEVPWYLYLGQMVVVIAVAAFSYYAIENPIRHGAIGRFLKAWATREASVGKLVMQRLVPIASATALAACAVVALVVVPPVTTHELSLAQEQEAPTLAYTGDSWRVDTVISRDIADDPDADPAERARYTDFLLIGDSVTAGMRDVDDEGGYGTFHQYFPKATLNSAVSRQLSTAQEFYDAEIAGGWNGDIVVFELGSNGASSSDEVNAMIELVPPEKKVFLVNVRTPSAYQDINNGLFADAAKRYDNVTLIDWYGYSAGHDDWFEGDGTHLKPSGCEKYMEMVKASLISYYERETAIRSARAGEIDPLHDSLPLYRPAGKDVLVD